MPEIKKLSQEELDSVKAIKNEYTNLAVSLGELELQKANIAKEKQRILDTQLQLIEKENEIAKKLLGQTASIKDLQDPETIIDYVIKLPNYEELVADARETLGREGVKLPEAGKVESFTPGSGAWFRKMIEVVK
jgi:hypothetical protein